ncbi:hypothetical protein F5Y15DRAFT_386356 [Xylariaceae sp. FL0016]|nr:hypothetical protein F5Y15DRAFT_386356 [Xylariaceae sp. FL0016]
MRVITTTILLLSLRAQAFDIYLNYEPDCPDEIDFVCEEISANQCCNGDPGKIYSSAQASDGVGPVTLYALDQGQSPNSRDRCSLLVARNHTCASVPIPMGSAAKVVMQDHREDSNAGGGEEAGDRAGDRAQAGNSSPNKTEDELPRVKQINAWAAKDDDYVWKLQFTSERAPAFKALTDSKEQIAFVKEHGKREPRPPGLKKCSKEKQDKPQTN